MSYRNAIERNGVPPLTGGRRGCSCAYHRYWNLGLCLAMTAATLVQAVVLLPAMTATFQAKRAAELEEVERSRVLLQARRHLLTQTGELIGKLEEACRKAEDLKRRAKE